MKYSINRIITYVKGIKEDGALILTCSPLNLYRNGFECGDMFNVVIDRVIVLVVPFVEKIALVGFGGLCLCDYEGSNTEITLKLHSGNFQKRIGGNIGSTIEIIPTGTHDMMYDYYAKELGTLNSKSFAHISDCTFSNYRMISTNGICEGKIFRSCNPIYYPELNRRALCSDSISRKYKIRTAIGLANEIDSIDSIKSSIPQYMKTIYENGLLFTRRIEQDFFSDSSLKIVHDALKFMIAHAPPYLIFCNEGKDRTGVFSILLEGLMGASTQEILEDYMISYINYYGISKSSSVYNYIESTVGKRILYSIAHPECLNTIAYMNWDNIEQEIYNVDWSQIIESFLINNVKLHYDELRLLKSVLRA